MQSSDFMKSEITDHRLHVILSKTRLVSNVALKAIHVLWLAVFSGVRRMEHNESRSSSSASDHNVATD